MARNNDFDDEEGFFESLAKYRDKVPMPESMSRMFVIGAGAAVFLVVGLVTYAVWPGGQSTEDSVPVVRYADSEYKVKPDEPGGMPIPNKDSTVFETMNSASNTDKKVENLLEDAEEPMSKDEVFESAEKTEAQPEPKVEEKPAVVAEKEEVKEEPKEEPKAEVKAVEEAEVKVVEKVEPKPVAKTSVIEQLKEDAGTAKPKTPAKGSSYIQLAAVKSDADAKAKWAKLQSQYASLKPLSLRVQKADLGEKGVFYRVQGGPVSASDATSICGKIKAAGGACIIAK